MHYIYIYIYIYIYNWVYVCCIIKHNKLIYSNVSTFVFVRLLSLFYKTKIRPSVEFKMKIRPCFFVFKNVYIFQSYVKHFLIFPHERHCRIMIWFMEIGFQDHPIMFLDRNNKMNLVPTPFSYF